MVAHHRAEFSRPRATRRAVADGQRTLAVQVLDEHVVADDPLVVLAQMGEKSLVSGSTAWESSSVLGAFPSMFDCPARMKTFTV